MQLVIPNRSLRSHTSIFATNKQIFGRDSQIKQIDSYFHKNCNSNEKHFKVLCFFYLLQCKSRWYSKQQFLQFCEKG